MQDWLPPFIDGSLRERYLLLFGAAGAFGLMTGLVGAWIGAYFGGRRGARRAILNMEPKATALADAQFTELRQAVETIALEVERISEGQRFTARVLMERVPPSAPVTHRREGGAITPH